MRIYSWNVNGVRAAMRKGMATWLAEAQPDILCLQETRLDAAAVPEEFRTLLGYHTYWSPLTRPGYGGVATFSREEPLAWRVGIDSPDFDDEARILVTDYPSFSLYNVYFPNGRSSPQRLAYKLAFYEAFQQHVNAQVRAEGSRCLIICGDVNTAHQDLDIAHPERHRRESGFLPEERAWLDRFLADGWVDSFRHFHPEQAGAYTWWYPTVRDKNVGWRLDYGFVPRSCLGQLVDAGISPEVRGSDHCPIWLEMQFAP